MSDTDDVFPINDGIVPFSTPDVPVGYDLTRLLSETMRARPPWLDLMKATSRVLYSHVEQTRRMLGAQRDSTSVSRVLKISLLRMMGIDWNSDALTDADYDRMVADVSLYCANHGTADFVAFMGYSLGLPLNLVPLWTRDYLQFVGRDTGLDGMPSVLDDATPGPWYPTSHVGILYDELAPNASDADAAVLTNIFYRVAPIHLVLQWVASQLTLSVGTLIASLNEYEYSEDFVDAGFDPTMTLYYGERHYSLEDDMVFMSPLYPARDVRVAVASSTIDTGVDRAVANAPATQWSPVAGQLYPLQVIGGFNAPENVSGTLVTSLVPNFAWTDPSGTWTGLLVQPDVTALVSSSGNPNYSTWLQSGVKPLQTFTRYDGGPGWNVSTTAGGLVATGTLGQPAPTTDVVMFAFRPTGGTPTVSVTRGTDRINFNCTSHVTTSPNPALRCGAYSIGSGFWVMWGLMTGDAVVAWPAGTGTTGSLDWLDLQVLLGRGYPMSVPSTVPLPGSVPVWNYVLGTDFGADENADFGAAIVSNQSYNYLGGVATVDYTFLSGAPQGSVPTTLTGTRCLLPTEWFRYPAGVCTFDLVPLQREWTNSGPQTVIDVQNALGDGFRVVASPAGLTLKLYGTGASVTVAPVPANPLRWGLAWSPGLLVWYVGGVAHPVAGVLPANLITASLCADIGSDAGSTWVVRRVLVVGTSDATQLPGASYMVSATT